MNRKVIPLTALLLVHFQVALSQSVLTYGKIETIASTRLQETRELYIYQPQSTQLKPLILVLDGEVHFESVVSTVRFMNNASEMPQLPEAIVVGIPNTQRQRDMPVPQQYGVAGEADFTFFIMSELLPYLHKNYPLNGHVIVIGHSQGGLFATYLLGKHPELFQWVVALDAPMEGFTTLNKLKREVVTSLKNQSRQRKYLSFEAVYGWKGEWNTYFASIPTAKQVEVTLESHESMPYKSIYDGLKFLFQDFTPNRKDLPLKALQSHYDDWRKRVGYEYTIPLQILLTSARRKLSENRKQEILELLDYGDQHYGKNAASERLRAEAEKISSEPDPLLEHYLSLPLPSEAQLKPFLGTWVGETQVTGGQNMPTKYEVAWIDDKPSFLITIGRMTPGAPDVLHVTASGELVVGSRNKSGGLFIATLKKKENELSGPRLLVGFTIPDSWSEEMKTTVQSSLEKQKDDRIYLNRQ